MDRAFDLPARHEMESALVEFAARGGVAVRYDCEWRSTGIEDDGWCSGRTHEHHAELAARLGSCSARRPPT
jgi:hypothetical protein